MREKINFHNIRRTNNTAVGLGLEETNFIKATLIDAKVRKCSLERLVSLKYLFPNKETYIFIGIPNIDFSHFGTKPTKQILSLFPRMQLKRKQLKPQKKR